MKKIIFLSSALLFSAFLMAQPPSGKAEKGNNYGQTVKVENAISTDKLNEILSKETESKPLTVQVEGDVTEVCKAEGCWIRVKSSTGDFLVKMKDHAFLVPVDLEGKRVVIAGTASLKETSVKALRHYAEDAGKSKEEIEAINKPEMRPVIIADGLVVL